MRIKNMNDTKLCEKYLEWIDTLNKRFPDFNYKHSDEPKSMIDIYVSKPIIH